MNFLKKLLGRCEKAEKVFYSVDIGGYEYAVASRYQDILRFAVTYDGTRNLVFCVEDPDNKKVKNATIYYRGFGVEFQNEHIIETEYIKSQEVAKLFREHTIEKINI